MAENEIKSLVIIFHDGRIQEYVPKDDPEEDYIEIAPGVRIYDPLAGIKMGWV